MHRFFRSPYSNLERSNEIIFIHIPKAAGNAVIQSLYCADATGHDPLTRYRDHDRDLFTTYFKFAVVRNPWDRFVSSFHYLKQGGIGYFDKDFSRKYLHDTPDFNAFVEKMMTNKNFEKSVMRWIHFIPQIDFISLSGKKVDLDYLVKLEKLDTDFPVLSKKLGLDDKSLTESNKSIRDNYQTYYTDKSRQYVYELYKNDCEILNYKFDN